MASRFTGSSSMKISSKLWCISSAAVIFPPCFLFASVTIFPLTFPAILPPGISLKILGRNREWLVRNRYHSMKTLSARAAKGGRQMQVSEGSDTFEFRSPHGMKAAHSRLRTFAGIAVRHLQLTRDSKGVLVAEFHSNDGPFTFTAQDHTEFVDAFYRIA